MSSTRPPTDFELEELLAALENSSEAKETLQLDDVAGFLSSFQILPGKNLVRFSLLYELYKLWSKNPSAKTSFAFSLNRFLLPQYVDQIAYYLINRDAFLLSSKSYQLLQTRTRDKTKSPFYKRHYEAFLKHYGLKPGKYWLESFVLFYLYDKWVLKKQNPLGEYQFMAFSKLYFIHKRRSRDTRLMWFAVDESILQHLPPEHLAQIRQAHKKYHAKKDKKKQRKIPSAAP
jgi:hypothetical protein